MVWTYLIIAAVAIIIGVYVEFVCSPTGRAPWPFDYWRRYPKDEAKDGGRYRKEEWRD